MRCPVSPKIGSPPPKPLATLARPALDTATLPTHTPFVPAAPRTNSPPLLPLSDAEPAASLARAVDSLRAGQLVIFPTDTVYGIAASAASADAITRLHASRGALTPGTSPDEARQPSAWHAPSAEQLARVIPLVSPLHKRVVRVLLPGPITLLVELAPDQLAALRTQLGVVPGAIDDGHVVVARAPDSTWARRLAAAADFPIAAEGVRLSGAASARSAHEAARALLNAGVDFALALDGGPASLGKPSTVLRLTADGAYRLVRPGVYDSAYIERRLRRTMLFVCTGNTCRSPMAEALAASMLPTGPDQVPTLVRSAGVAAAAGSPATAETVHAVESLGIRHRFTGSRPVTPDMLRDADAVFAMTRSHLAALRSMAPGEGAKLQLLDPAGRDVPDPIGSGQAAYTSLAGTLRPMIAARLKELES